MNLQGGIKIGLTREEQYLNLLNTVKCTIKPSPIHGVGVFALRDIKKGDRCYVVPDRSVDWFSLGVSDLNKFDAVYPEIKELILARWPLVASGSKFLSPNYDVRLVAFLNHSDHPNYDQATDTALEDIKAGEEIVEDYRLIQNFEKVFPFLRVIPS